MRTQRETRAPGETEHIGRGPRYADSPLRHSTRATLVMQLQRDAGNRAVTGALTANETSSLPASLHTLQLEAAAPPSGAAPDPGLQGDEADAAPTPAQGDALGAIWNEQVVVPLGRAADRVGRAAVDLKGARADLEGALRTIATFRNATKADDPNRLRYDIIERRARAVLELVLQKQGAGKTDDQLQEDTRKVRGEAMELGPQLQHAPQSRVGPKGGDQPAAASGGGPGSASSPAPAPTPGTTPVAPSPHDESTDGGPRSETGPAAGAAPANEFETIADLWDFLVVKRLWAGQRGIIKEPRYAIIDYEAAESNILEFLAATPDGHPNRLKLMRLQTGIEVIAAQLAKKSPAFASDPIANLGIYAWNSAVAMYDYLHGGTPTGASKPTPKGAEAPAGAQEPNFTWEREKPARTDDTALERP